MALCNGCGQQSTRIRTTMTDDRGRLLPEDQRKEICQHCAPEQFSEPCDPFARYIEESQARPYLYDTLPDGSKRLKESPTADVWAEMTRDQDEEALQRAIEHKRRTRRTAPLSQTEIEQADAAWRDYFREMKAEEERVLDADKLATENIVLKYVRESEIERGKTKTYLT